METFDPAEWHRTLVEMRRSDEARVADRAQEIDNLARSVDAVRLFVAVAANVAIAPVDCINEATFGSVPAKMELLAYHLYPHFGSSDEADITPWHTNACIEALEDLFTARIRARAFSGIEGKTLLTLDEAPPADRIRDDLRIEADVVRGSAYPKQTAKRIIDVQGRFEDWFIERVGIGPIRAQALLWAVMQAQQKAIDSFIPDVREHARYVESCWKEARKKRHSKQRTKEEIVLLRILKDSKIAGMFGYVQRLNRVAPDLFPVGIRDLVGLEPPLTCREWDALIDLIGVTTANRKSMTSPADVRQRPLFVLPDNRVLLVDISNALDMLWNQLEQVAKKDQPFFFGVYQKGRAEWLESRTVEHLSKIFPSRCIYRGLAYPDPDKPSGAAAELDAAVRWGPFLVLVEAKAKQFRMESQLGDIGRLYTDIRANVEDAFEQARRAVRYIRDTPSPEFTELSSGRKLVIEKNNIQRIYLLTVSLHNLAGLATRLSLFQGLGLFQDGEFPFSISIADLETVSRFCDGPEIFLHYVERRLELQRRSEDFLADELDLWGAYLDTRLQGSRLWKNRKFDAIALSGFSEPFYTWSLYELGDLDTPPTIKLDIPAEIHGILAELRGRDDDGAKWIAFALLDMSDSILGAIAQAFRDLQETQPAPGMFRRFVYQDGDTVVSIVASLDLPPERLYERTEMWAVLEKYRHKAFRSIGFGVMVLNTERPFEHAIWGESEWVYDEELERAIEAAPPFVPAPGQNLPSRNEPCICGSGKKFKNCCLRRIQEAQRGGIFENQ